MNIAKAESTVSEVRPDCSRWKQSPRATGTRLNCNCGSMEANPTLHERLTGRFSGSFCIFWNKRSYNMKFGGRLNPAPPSSHQIPEHLYYNICFPIFLSLPYCILPVSFLSFWRCCKIVTTPVEIVCSLHYLWLCSEESATSVWQYGTQLKPRTPVL